MTSPSYQSSFFDHGSNSQASQQFFFFLLSYRSSLIFSHAKRYEAFSTNVSQWSKCAPYVRFPRIFRGPDPFCVPNLAVSRAKRQNLGGGGAAKGAWRGRYFNCPVFKYMPPFFFACFVKCFLVSKDERIFVVFIEQTHQIG